MLWPKHNQFNRIIRVVSSIGNSISLAIPHGARLPSYLLEITFIEICLSAGVRLNDVLQSADKVSPD